MMEGRDPNFELLAFDFGFAFFFLFAGLLLLNKLGSRAAEKL